MKTSNLSFNFSQFSNQELLDLLKQMTKIADKKGVVVVIEDDIQITTYNLSSYNRKLAKKALFNTRENFYK